MRKIKITPDYTEFALGSVLVEVGKTKVLCTAMVEESVPKFLADTGSGWVTAEYDMLPSSTPSRNKRAARRGAIKGRTSEIQRLIGRALRAGINLSKLGPRTVYIDCDVMQADGGTRTASVNGGFSALYLACRALVKNGTLEENPITRHIGAVSVGIVDGKTVVDLDYRKDSTAEVDMNVIMDEKGRIIEIQGTAEHNPFTRSSLNSMVAQAWKSIEKIITYQKKALNIK
jgi:ribonuclease PH